MIGSIDTLFEQPGTHRCLEIGFGGGEHMIHRLSTQKERCFVGVEPFVNGMAKAVAAAQRANVTDRLRLWDQDAALLLDRLPAGSFDTVYLLYPDPWPKRRHWKRRFVRPENVDRIARILRPGGHFWVASDIEHYVDWTLMHLCRDERFTWTATRPADWQTPEPDWPGTRYEHKARREGRRSSYLQFARNVDT